MTIRLNVARSVGGIAKFLDCIISSSLPGRPGCSLPHHRERYPGVLRAPARGTIWTREAPMPERGREQRRAKRTKRRNAAWIVLPSEGVRIPCVLWDISIGGARIAAARANALPAVFRLSSGHEGQAERFCRVVWRKDGQVGVKFIDEAAAERELGAPSRRGRGAAPPPPPARGAGGNAGDLLLPGCGPSPVVYGRAPAEPRRFGWSSVALAMVVLLAGAAGLFVFADMQSALEAPWALAVCGQARNFCAHPEWTATASGVMTVVWLAARGMEL
jgi:hypothetical protein